jgi:hypothetical protein
MGPFVPSCPPRDGTDLGPDLEGAGHLFRAFGAEVGANVSV